MTDSICLDRDIEAIARELPASYKARWNSTRKAAVVRAVHAGMISKNKALERYRLSHSEFRSWQRSFETAGVDGLSVRELQAH